MKHLVRSMTLAALLLATAAVASAAPNTVSFTARLSGSSGPISGNVDATFRVFDAATAGTMMWEETQTGLTADEGVFYAELGSTASNGLDASVFDGRSMFLEVVVNGETFDPRLPINSVPYAISAGSAELLGTLAEGDVVTGVSAGSGLSGGGSGGDVSVSVDTTVVQSRVAGTCAAGQAIRVIAATGQVTCESTGGNISGITAGAGLNGGGTSGNVNLSVDTTTIQARVTGSCTAGQAIRVIAATGQVTCENTGDITEVLAGAGLVGGGVSGSVGLAVDTNTIQARVGTACPAGSSIRQILANGGVACETDDAGTGDITGVAAGTGLTGGGTTGNVSLGLATNGVTTTQIADGTIGSIDIAANAVRMSHTSAPMGSGSASAAVGVSNAATGSGHIWTGSTFTADSNGTCFVTTVAMTTENGPYNAYFYSRPALNAGGSLSNGGVAAYASEMSGAGNNGFAERHTSNATWTFSIVAGTAYRFGCHVGTNNGFSGNTYSCYTSYICN